MNHTLKVLASTAAITLLSACGGGQAPSDTPVDATSAAAATTTVTTTTLATTAATATSKTTAGSKPAITPDMVHRVAAPLRPNNGATAEQPGLPEPGHHGDKAGNTRRSPTRVIATDGVQ